MIDLKDTVERHGVERIRLDAGWALIGEGGGVTCPVNMAYAHRHWVWPIWGVLDALPGAVSRVVVLYLCLFAGAWLWFLGKDTVEC